MKVPSRQQARWLRELPLQDRQVKTMNGNHVRTVKSLVDHGWAAWDGSPAGLAMLEITDAGRQAVERYKVCFNEQRQKKRGAVRACHR